MTYKKTKTIAMIPARAGSKRIKNKNLRILNGLALIEYPIKLALMSKYIDEIYINTDSKEILELIGLKYPQVKHFERNAELASDKATNDDFMFNFLNNVLCYNVIQILATSPFLKISELDSFIEHYFSKDVDTLISVKKNQIECILDNNALNFDPAGNTLPSQDLKPIFSYACSLMMWKSSTFIKNYENNLGAYHGGKQSKDYFLLEGFSTVDIDYEEDFKLAEAIVNIDEKTNPRYYKDQRKHIYDRNVDKILNSDGVKINFEKKKNLPKVNIKSIVDSMPKDKSWSYTIIDSESNRSTLIAQKKGEGNRRHYHNNWDEWWYIIQGEWEFEIDNKIKKAEKDDVIFIERNKIHKIKSITNELSIRMAVSRSDVDHIYMEEDY